jgi:hypothetical protein
MQMGQYPNCVPKASGTAAFRRVSSAGTGPHGRSEWHENSKTMKPVNCAISIMETENAMKSTI